MSTTVLMPVEEYLMLSEKPTNEYRDGVLCPKPMPTGLHGLIQAMLVILLHKTGLKVATEVMVQLTPTKYLVPDVIAAPAIQLPYPTQPVPLVCEILSPRDHIGAVLAKCEEYHAWGVPYCWVIDPVRLSVWEYHSGDEPTKVTGPSLRAGEYSISVKELFSEIPSC